MRSMTATLEKGPSSAFCAHSTISEALAPGRAAGSPMPIFMLLLLVIC